MTDARSFNLSLTVQEIDSARPVSVSDVLFGQGKPAFTIGSHEKSHLRIADPEVAPSHAVVSLQDGEYWIAPRFPHYSVLIDDLPVKRPTQLTNGSVVRLGGYTLSVSTQPVPELNPPISEDSTALSRDYMPRSPATLDVASPVSAQVYFPRVPAQQRSSRSVLLAALLVVVLIAVSGYALYTRVFQPGMQEVAVANPFAFNDGNATLLMFDATWCGANCINQKSILQQVAGQFRGDVYINYADVESPGNEFLLMAYRVTTVPFIVIFNDQGEPVTAFSGPTDSASLYQAVTAALRLSKGSSLPGGES